tara:strand:- start:23 stop:247 length:225 start_codon:yes stop_codon:yes gene_type:complete
VVYYKGKGENMTYTAVFRDCKGKYIFEPHVGTHDRTSAWKQISESQEDSAICLVLLIDGQAAIKTYDDIVDMGG